MYVVEVLCNPQQLRELLAHLEIIQLGSLFMARAASHVSRLHTPLLSLQ